LKHNTTQHKTHTHPFLFHIVTNVTGFIMIIRMTILLLIYEH